MKEEITFSEILFKLEAGKKIAVYSWMEGEYLTMKKFNDGTKLIDENGQVQELDTILNNIEEPWYCS